MNDLGDVRPNDGLGLTGGDMSKRRKCCVKALELLESARTRINAFVSDECFDQAESDEEYALDHLEAHAGKDR